MPDPERQPDATPPFDPSPPEPPPAGLDAERPDGPPKSPQTGADGAQPQ